MHSNLANENENLRCGDQVGIANRLDEPILDVLSLSFTISVGVLKKQIANPLVYHFEKVHCFAKLLYAVSASINSYAASSVAEC